MLDVRSWKPEVANQRLEVRRKTVNSFGNHACATELKACSKLKNDEDLYIAEFKNRRGFFVVKAC